MNRTGIGRLKILGGWPGRWKGFGMLAVGFLAVAGSPVVAVSFVQVDGYVFAGEFTPEGWSSQEAIMPNSRLRQDQASVTEAIRVGSSSASAAASIPGARVSVSGEAANGGDWRQSGMALANAGFGERVYVSGPWTGPIEITIGGRMTGFSERSSVGHEGTRSEHSVRIMPLDGDFGYGGPLHYWQTGNDGGGLVGTYEHEFRYSFPLSEAGGAFDLFLDISGVLNQGINFDLRTEVTELILPEGFSFTSAKGFLSDSHNGGGVPDGGAVWLGVLVPLLLGGLRRGGTV